MLSNLQLAFCPNFAFLIVGTICFCFVLYVFFISKTEIINNSTTDFADMFLAYLVIWWCLNFLFFYSNDRLIYYTVVCVIILNQALFPYLIAKPKEMPSTLIERLKLLWTPTGYIELRLFWMENYRQRLKDSFLKETLTFIVLCIISFFTLLTTRFIFLHYIIFYRLLLSCNFWALSFYVCALLSVSFLANSKFFCFYIAQHYGSSAIKRLGFNNGWKQALGHGIQGGKIIGLTALGGGALDVLDEHRSSYRHAAVIRDYKKLFDEFKAHNAANVNTPNFVPEPLPLMTDLPAKESFRRFNSFNFMPFLAKYVDNKK